jgi:acyl carrier protein
VTDPTTPTTEEALGVRERIRSFIAAEVLFDGSGELSDETFLLNGAMDSLGLMQLVAFLEEEFGVEIDDAEVTVENFRTVRDIAALVAQATDGSKDAGPA